MKHFNFLILNIILFSTTTAFQVQKNYLVESKVITIPDTLPIGEVSFLDVDEGKVLLTDQPLGNVYLLVNDDWRKLDPEECYPGFQFRPIEGHFSKSNTIFISNTGIWGFRFGSEGECGGAAHKDFRAPQRFDIGTYLVGLSNTAENTIITKWSLEGKFLDTLFTFPNRFKSAEFRLSIGGILESEDAVYAVNGLDPVIHKYDMNTKELITTEFSQPDYLEPKKDLPEDPRSIEFIRQAQDFMKSYSMNYNLYDLNDESILLVVRKFGKDKFQYHSYIFDKISLKLLGTFIVKNRLVYAGENQVVYVYRESEDYENEKVHLVFNRLIK